MNDDYDIYYKQALSESMITGGKVLTIDEFKRIRKIRKRKQKNKRVK